ncbi:MAG: 50S ribosomal protein L25 [Candidatus Fermentibacteraceae bacterium]|nr:50S ribosomal protein L25 [Candidatus Fermentibacteraceae bacterium]
MPIQLVMEKRTNLGSRESRRLRRSGSVPGIIYGQGSDMAVKLPLIEFMTKIGYSKSLGIVELSIDGNVLKSIIKEVQWDTLTDKPLHLDFQQVSDNQLVLVPVPVKLTGIPVGVSIDGGILDHTMHELEVMVKAVDIPSDITFDVTELHLGDRLHLSDVDLPEGLTVDLAFDPVIASVIAPKALLVKEDEEEEAEEGAEGAEGETAEGGEDSSEE